MSNTTRWILAIIFILAGVMTAAFSLFFLGFFTWECYGPSNSTAYTILYVAAAISLASGVAPAVMLVLKTSGMVTGIVIATSIIFTLAGIGAFMYYTLNIC
jgi:hypothetical protein